MLTHQSILSSGVLLVIGGALLDDGGGLNSPDIFQKLMEKIGENWRKYLNVDSSKQLVQWSFVCHWWNIVG